MAAAFGIAPHGSLNLRNNAIPATTIAKDAEEAGLPTVPPAEQVRAIAASSSLHWVCSLTSQHLVWLRSLVMECEVQSRQLFITAPEQPEGSVAFRTHKPRSHNRTVDSLSLRR